MNHEESAAMLSELLGMPVGAESMAKSEQSAGKPLLEMTAADLQSTAADLQRDDSRARSPEPRSSEYVGRHRAVEA
jgi:hypothetical protein